MRAARGRGRAGSSVLLAALLSAGCNALLGLDERPAECAADLDCGATTDCRTNRCVEGLCESTDAAPNAPCSEPEGGLCNGSGVCNPPSCDDRVANQGETDIDCGGPCGPCAAGQSCSSPADCQSGLCPADDGVCCQTACDAPCMSCAGFKTGDASGTCAPVLLGTDPDGECRGDPLECEVAGCNGQASAPACNRMAAGAVCRGDADPPEGGCDKPEVCGQIGPCPDDVGANAVCELDDDERSSTCAADCGVVHIAAGAIFACAALADGSTRCWGNTFGQDPFNIEGLDGAPKQLAIKYDQACVIDADDEVACWGYNTFGTLGDGTTTDSLHTARRVLRAGGDEPLTAAAIAVGYHHACAVAPDQTVWCWGLNNAGQLGNADGSACNPSQPGAPCASKAVQVGGLAGVTDVFLGAQHSCAIHGDGTVWCWGHNDAGQIGCVPSPGGGVATATPTQVAGLSGVLRGAAGWTSTCVATAAGIQCFGGNQWGQLGDGGTSASCSPVSAQGLGGTSALTSGFSPQCFVGCADLVEHYCAVRDDDGTVMCWGANGWGQLGIGFNNFEPSGLPTAVLRETLEPLSGVEQLACGGRSCLALVGDGSARVWGANDYGQLAADVVNSAPVAVGQDRL